MNKSKFDKPEPKANAKPKPKRFVKPAAVKPNKSEKDARAAIKATEQSDIYFAFLEKEADKKKPRRFETKFIAGAGERSETRVLKFEIKGVARYASDPLKRIVVDLFDDYAPSGYRAASVWPDPARSSLQIIATNVTMAAHARPSAWVCHVFEDLINNK